LDTVAVTYSRTNRIRLYVNGTLNGTTGSIVYLASGQANTLTLPNRLQGTLTSAGGTCTSQSIVPDVYFGDMDEFRVYSRELNASDVYTLANPSFFILLERFSLLKSKNLDKIHIHLIIDLVYYEVASIER
jgi:hypothetical protein